MPDRFQMTLTTILVAVLAVPAMAQAAELKPATREALDRYIRLTQQRMQEELQAGHPFLLPDSWPPQRRDQAYQQLRRDEMIIERLDTRDQGREIKVPDGLIHHWAGVVFVPGASLEQTLAVIHDYNHHQTIYAPEVVRSRLLSRQGDDFHIFLRLRKHKIVTVVLDTEYDAHFVRLDPRRAYSFSHSTKVAEVENPGSKDEHELPPGHDHGYMWALDTYWRFLEVEDGVFVQCEAISLTRDVPTGLGWLIGPFIQSIPRESLTFTLSTTRKAVSARIGATAH